MPAKLNLAGQRFGLWTVTNNYRPRKGWLCVCDCGTRRRLLAGSLRSKHAISCGCFRSTAEGKAVQRKAQQKNYGDPEKRFWSNVKIGKKNECWPWTKAIGDDGYPVSKFTFEDRVEHRSARIAWRLSHKRRKIPKKWLVRHSCDNPPCCNPSHLRIGTHRRNVDDQIKRNRVLRGDTHWRSRLTEIQVQSLRLEYKKLVRAKGSKYGLYPKLARKYRVPWYVVSCAIRGVCYKHV